MTLGIACQVRERPPQLLRMSDDRQAGRAECDERSGRRRGRRFRTTPRQTPRRARPSRPRRRGAASRVGRDREQRPRLVDDRQRQRDRRQRRPVIGREQHGRDRQRRAQDLLGVADEDRVEDRRHAHAQRDDAPLAPPSSFPARASVGRATGRARPTASMHSSAPNRKIAIWLPYATASRRVPPAPSAAPSRRLRRWAEQVEERAHDGRPAGRSSGGRTSAGSRRPSGRGSRATPPRPRRTPPASEKRYVAAATRKATAGAP